MPSGEMLLELPPAGIEQEPKPGWHPVEQYAEVLPHQPYLNRESALDSQFESSRYLLRATVAKGRSKTVPAHGGTTLTRSANLLCVNSSERRKSDKEKRTHCELLTNVKQRAMNE